MFDLVTICASHINSYERILSLKKLLEIIKKDNGKKGIIYKHMICVGISYEHDFKNVVHNLQTEYPHVYFVIQIKKNLQFEHYQHISHFLRFEKKLNAQTSWLLFCDDDDICSKDREEVYASMIQEAIQSGQHVVYPIGYLMTLIQTSQSVSYLSLDEILKRDIGKIEERASMEHVMFSCTLNILFEFTNSFGQEILSFEACDLLWRNSIIRLPCFTKCFDKTHHALYFYIQSYKNDGERDENTLGGFYYKEYIQGKKRNFGDIWREDIRPYSPDLDDENFKSLKNKLNI